MNRGRDRAAGTVRERRVDGRTLAWAEYGTATGFPVFFFHGNPGSRLAGRLLDEAARDADVRLVAPDRPGFGRSEPRPDRTLLDWGDDVAALADGLGLDRYSVLGHSAGGPHALACGAAPVVRDRLETVGLLGGVAPPAAPHDDQPLANRLLSATARRAPWALGLLFRVTARLADRRSPSFVTQTLSDREVGDAPGDIDPGVAATVRRDFLEAFRDGPGGAVHEFGLLARPWGFDLSSVSVPVVARYGGDDSNVPPSHAAYLSRHLPACDDTVVPGVDHLGVLAQEGGALLRAVTPA